MFGKLSLSVPAFLLLLPAAVSLPLTDMLWIGDNCECVSTGHVLERSASVAHALVLQLSSFRRMP